MRDDWRGGIGQKVGGRRGRPSMEVLGLVKSPFRVTIQHGQEEAGDNKQDVE